jgi:hypothetical protein
MFLCLLAGLMAPGIAAAQTLAAEHPLDALKTPEYWAVYDVLRATGRIDAETYYAWRGSTAVRSVGPE